jgi:hypothetical protein
MTIHRVKEAVRFLKNVPFRRIVCPIGSRQQKKIGKIFT